MTADQSSLREHKSCENHIDGVIWYRKREISTQRMVWPITKGSVTVNFISRPYIGIAGTDSQFGWSVCFICTRYTRVSLFSFSRQRPDIRSSHLRRGNCCGVQEKQTELRKKIRVFKYVTIRENVVFERWPLGLNNKNTDWYIQFCFSTCTTINSEVYKTDLIFVNYREPSSHFMSYIPAWKYL